MSPITYVSDKLKSAMMKRTFWLFDLKRIAVKKVQVEYSGLISFELGYTRWSRKVPCWRNIVQVIHTQSPNTLVLFLCKWFCEFDAFMNKNKTGPDINKVARMAGQTYSCKNRSYKNFYNFLKVLRQEKNVYNPMKRPDQRQCFVQQTRTMGQK